MTEQRKNNCMRILSHIKKHGSITTDICRFKLNIRRCSARIYDLKHIFNHDIKSTMQNSNGDRFAIYTIKGVRDV